MADQKPDPQKEYLAQMTAVLSTLVQAPGWDMYVDILSDIRGRKIHQTLQETKETFDFNRGVIAGLDLVLSIPAIYKNRTRQNVSN